jgi:4'-phosphopantetheinyl transferase EntD
LTREAADGIPGAWAALCGADVVCESAPPALVTAQLYPEEQRYIAHAVETRQAQFGTARLCARRALARLGIPAGPLVPNQDRSPHWPDGIRGSIAHTSQQCAVAVSRAAHITGLGIDLESDAPLEAGLEIAICTEYERAWIERYDRTVYPWLVTLVFSAKEAFYKCQYPITGAKLEFTDVELRVDLAAATFSICDLVSTVPQRHRLMKIAGRFCHRPQLIMTSAVLREQ